MQLNNFDKTLSTLSKPYWNRNQVRDARAVCQRQHCSRLHMVVLTLPPFHSHRTAPAFRLPHPRLQLLVFIKSNWAWGATSCCDSGSLQCDVLIVKHCNVIDFGYIRRVNKWCNLHILLMFVEYPSNRISRQHFIKPFQEETRPPG